MDGITEIDGPQDDQFNDDTAAPRFAESIEAAMQVVEKMLERFPMIDIALHRDGQRMCRIFRSVKVTYTNDDFIYDTGATTTEAICRAALAAIETKDE